MVENTPNYQIRFAKKAQKDIAELTEQQKAKLQQIVEQVIAVNLFKLLCRSTLSRLIYEISVIELSPVSSLSRLNPSFQNSVDGQVFRK